jgi:hypothetical protein
MKVAVLCDQHSVMFGHRASSQTVATPLVLTTARVVAMTPVGIGRLSHGGKRRCGVEDLSRTGREVNGQLLQKNNAS